jgi:hypothetical protein
VRAGLTPPPPFPVQMQEITNEFQSVQSRISSTEQLINIELDSTRNAIMRLDLFLVMGTFSLSSGGKTFDVKLSFDGPS